MIELTGPLRGALHLHAIEAEPKEAVGVIYNGKAYHLTNHAYDPEANFEIHLDELRSLVIDQLGVPLQDLEEQVALWHSHPNGGVGPSRFDMQHRTPLKHHLVVTLLENDVAFTWY